MNPELTTKPIAHSYADVLRRLVTRLSLMVIGGICMFAVCLIPSTQAAADGLSFMVQNWETDSPDATRLYQTLPYKERKWELCVALPHIKDSYWLAANYGISDQVKRLGVGMRLFHAGGYGNVDVQIRQVRECVASGGDAVILAALSHDGLNPLIAELTAKGIPVIDLINGISSTQVSARSSVSFADMGARVAKYLVRLYPKGNPTVEVGWFPGPYGAGWVKDGNQGFRTALQDSSAVIVSTEYGDTGKSVQRKLISRVLREHPSVRIIAGTAVTAEVAAHYLRKLKPSPPLTVVSYYFTQAVYRGIRRGQILAACTASPVLQARIAVDQAVRILEGKPYAKRVSPIIQLIDDENVRRFDRSTSVAPSGFRPTFIIHRGRK